MQKENLCNRLKDFEKFSVFSIKWDRGNGVIERMVSFEGFDKKGDPLLRFGDSGNYLNIESIKGYNSILSLEEECPDGYSFGKR